jgi:hypothetical protein
MTRPDDWKSCKQAGLLCKHDERTANARARYEWG